MEYWEAPKSKISIREKLPTLRLRKIEAIWGRQKGKEKNEQWLVSKQLELEKQHADWKTRPLLLLFQSAHNSQKASQQLSEHLINITSHHLHARCSNLFTAQCYSQTCPSTWFCDSNFAPSIHPPSQDQYDFSKIQTWSHQPPVEIPQWLSITLKPTFIRWSIRLLWSVSYSHPLLLPSPMPSFHSKAPVRMNCFHSLHSLIFKLSHVKFLLRTPCQLPSLTNITFVLFFGPKLLTSILILRPNLGSPTYTLYFTPLWYRSY